MKAYLGLGSNIGDRKTRLEKAIEAVDALPATYVTKVSGMIQTKACGKWDSSSAGDFLNCCVEIETALEPERLLERLKEIERKQGRPGKDRSFDENGERIYSDRCIDIDILLYGRRKIKTEKLEIPHPRMRERDFVMIPLKQINSKI